MNKGSLKKLLTDKTTHRVPKVATLALTTCVLVTMIALDASASPNSLTTLINRPTNVASTFASESSLSQLLGVGRHHPVKPSDPTPPSSGGGGGGTSGGGGGTSGGGGGGGGGTSGGGGSTTTTTVPSPTTTTTSPPSTTTTTTPPSNPTAAAGLITAGASRSECIAPTVTGSGLAGLQSAISSFDSLTGTTVTCITSYLNGAANWTQWTNPWISTPGYGYTDWVAEDPQVRQLVLQVDLIPDSLENVSDPLSWEQSCAAGDFDNYATELGQNLVAAGLQNSVIRLGAEMNGPWEHDFVGTTTQEQNLWATCFDNEVTGLRAASGSHFLIDWNPNACTEQIPYANYYPGNAYVDIMGLDLYDVGCNTPTTALSFSDLASESYGLASFEAFAAAQGKSMSFPEWGLESTPGGDDPGYVDGIASAVNNGNFAFQSYFDDVVGNTIPLSASTPLSNSEYQKKFG